LDEDSLVPALIQGVSIDAGAVYTEAWQYREPPLLGEPAISGAIINLTGWTATYAVRQKDPAPILSFTSGSPELTITPLEGLVTLFLSATDTAKLPFKPYVATPDGATSCHYTLTLTDENGEPQYLVTGPVVVFGP
jgi:hypothetical protein